ncbi:MAG TPA: S8 family serine peptidase [Tepidisphaeraceae bacterium]
MEPLETRRLMSVATPKLGDALSFLASDFSTRPIAHQSRAVYRNQPYTLAAGQPDKGLIRTHGDSVLVKAVSKVGGTSGLAEQLTSVGGTVQARFGRVVTASVPVSALTKIDSLSYLSFADPSYRPFTKAGKTENYAVQAMNAAEGSKQFAVDGTGVTVGILSDSYNNLSGAAAGVASGDLPSNVNVVRDLRASDGQGTGSDEGRGMAELVHDVAPGAGIAFASAFLGEPAFAESILTLAKPVANGGAGAQVVVDDIGYLDEPFFQDGIVAQAVTTAANTYGTSYFSAAGNSGRNSYEANFSGVNATANAISTIDAEDFPSADRSTTGTFQDFDPSATSNIYQRVTIPAGASFDISFQWDQPFLSASTAAGRSAGSASSVGVYLLNSAKTGVLEHSSESQVGQDAVQILSYENSGTTAVTAYLVAKVRSGPTPGRIKFVDYGDDGNDGTPITVQYATNSGTAVGHAVAPGGLGVGAAPYYATPAFEVSPAEAESFSSAGGVPILFAPNGTRLATPQYRNQPAIVAPDGGATTFFGQQDIIDYVRDGQYHFYGTSAAAPHAAAVAALLLQAKPSLTNTQVYAVLQNTAADMGPSGFDYDTGYGLVQADAALASVAGSTISGTSFRDINNNGIRDGSDFGLAGTTVFLDGNNNGLVDSGTTTLSSTSATAIADATATNNAPSRTTSSITSTLTGRVTGVKVSINVSHARTGQLGFTLVAPSGTRIPLLDNLGGVGAAGTGLNVTLSDAASVYIDSLGAASGVRTGTYVPLTPLAAAVNENAGGTWQMEARDYRSGTVGTLNSWSLELSYADPTRVTDSSGHYSFNALSPSAFYGTYRVRQTTPAGLTQSGPASAYDLTLTRGSTNTGRDFGNFAPLSTISSIVLDDGTIQRSRVRSLTLVFDGNIPAANIASDAFTLTQTSGTIAPYTVNVASVNFAAGKTTVSLTFSGSGVVAGSVNNGRFTLAIDGNKLTDSTGLKVDAAGTGTPGSIRTYDFYRLFGEVTGDARVTFDDFLKFQVAFNTTPAKAAYNSAFDSDGNQQINFNDFLPFQVNFNRKV